ncbi:MAG: type II toxin-antitoxin system HicA family toxin [Armatimonadetes bacterium]|jgi:predicted RNA binding protein YcfA (HicA-like mRNA interferase family)|nr:type II toxin-antitoxin system HicA family toxin [Armatimonadota bacterium]
MLNGIKPEKAIRAFEKAGGVVRKRGSGSHVVIKMPNGQLISIPDHGEIKSGLLQAAIRKAGLTTDEFLSFLRS